jgi:hypothetical protein
MIAELRIAKNLKPPMRTLKPFTLTLHFRGRHGSVAGAAGEAINI